MALFQYFASGEKIKLFYNFTDPHRYSYQNLEIKKSELIDLWGYKVKPWIAGIYSSLHLFGYIVLYHYNIKPVWLTTIFKIDFLTFMYGVVSFGLANAFLPLLLGVINLKNLLKSIQSMYWSSAIRSVKI